MAQLPEAAGALRGQVHDPQHRGVPAQVTASQRGTGLVRETEADAQGRFALPNLPPGATTLTVTAAGFAAYTVADLVIEVGRPVDIEIDLALANVREQVTVAGVDVVSSVVGNAITAREIDTLPLNGRNFLELAFLTPGNAPAPNFDPTKVQSVVVSSAGGLGRGGNVTIDAMDNNDDVVGGPLMNVPQDAVQEFQVATNSFSAELGRSAASVINVVTRSGSDELHGSAGLYVRDRRWQALPATGDPSLADPPFHREQVPVSVSGPLRRGQLFGFAAVEVRHQEGGVLAGTRDPVAPAIRREFVPAPLNDLLASGRVDWRPSSANAVSIRYSGQRQDDVASSALERPIGTASQRQESRNRIHGLLGSWTRVISARSVNAFSVSFSDFDNRIVPLAPGVQLTFPSLLAGSSFRVPQATRQRRWQLAESLSFIAGGHQWRVGGQFQRVDAAFDLGVFRDGRIEFVEDFPAFDRNGDGAVTDDDLLFAVTLRSGRPDQDLEIPDADNFHVAGYLQDDWRVYPQLTLNLGVRYELDTDVNNGSRVDELNPLVAPFVNGDRRRDTNNWAPRLGFNWASRDTRTSVRGGYGIYYDRITLQIQSLERGLDGRALPIEVRAGNLLFMDPATGRVPAGGPSVSNPFTGFILPGEGASGINIIDARLQNPMVQQASIGIERQLGAGQVIRADVVRDRGSRFIIGRTVGTVFNPVVGGPDRVVRLESSAKTNYQALLIDYQRRFVGRANLRAAYTLASASNYANDDQIPFGSGPLDPENLSREYGPSPGDRRHRLVVSGSWQTVAGLQLAGVWTLASGVPMDILMPDGRSRIPLLGRNAGGREFTTPAALNDFIRGVNADGGIDGEPLPLVSEAARFSDTFNALDLRVSRTLAIGRTRIEALAEVFNVFDVTNILGSSNVNYAGYINVLTRDDNDPASPGYLRSSRFGTAVSTAGGVFGTGGPRALQLAARVRF